MCGCIAYQLRTVGAIGARGINDGNRLSVAVWRRADCPTSFENCPHPTGNIRWRDVEASQVRLVSAFVVHKFLMGSRWTARFDDDLIRRGRGSEGYVSPPTLCPKEARILFYVFPSTLLTACTREPYLCRAAFWYRISSKGVEGYRAWFCSITSWPRSRGSWPGMHAGAERRVQARLTQAYCLPHPLIV